MSNAVLRRFQFSAESVFVIELGDLYMRFFTNRQQITSGSDFFEITSPYTVEDARDVKWAQVNDIVYLTHPDYPVYKLTRLSDTSWTLAQVQFDLPPFLDLNTTSTTLAASATTGTSITLTASEAVFSADHIGSFWRIGHKAPGAYVEHPITANGNSTSLQIYGTYNLRTYGNWGADILVQRSTDGGSSWETVANFHGAIPGAGEAGFRNFDAEGTADEVALYRIRIENFDSDSESSAIAVLERPEAIVYGYAQITAIGSPSPASSGAEGTVAIADVIEDFFSTDASDLWAEGAWSAVRGYPRACAVHEQRLIMMGTAYQPLTVWGSVTDDFENFDRGDGADADSFAHTLAAVGQAQIQWGVSREALIVGTSLGIWRVRGDGYGAVITPTRVDAKKRDPQKCAYVGAEECEAPIAFLDIKGRKIFALAYNEDNDRLENEELTLLSDEITDSGIVEMAWQTDKRILWCVRGDGKLVALTYDATQKVVGWHLHSTDGYFRSVTTILGDNDAEDEVWLLVERTVGSTQVFYVELLDPDFWDAKADYFGVDSGLSYEGSPITHVTGLTHLAGRDIVGLADGVPFTATVDANGEFDLPSGITAASVIHAGLAYTATLETFRLDADAALGVHIGKTKRLEGPPVARLAKTWGGKFYVAGEALPIPVPQTEETSDLLGDDRPEDVRLEGFQQDHTLDPIVKITQPDPLPFNIVALAVTLNVESG